MSDKTKVILTEKDGQRGEWKKGDTGFIDGYVRGGDERPYAVVVLDSNGTFVMVPIHSLNANKPKP